MRQPGGVRYQFVVDGALSQRAQAAFPELDARIDSRHATTSLHGALTDGTAVHGILARLATMGFEVIEFRQLPD